MDTFCNVTLSQAYQQQFETMSLVAAKSCSMVRAQRTTRRTAVVVKAADEAKVGINGKHLLGAWLGARFP